MISSWEGTNSLVFVFFKDSPIKWANISISVPGNSSLILRKSQKQEFYSTLCHLVKGGTEHNPCVPFQVKFEVAKDASAGEERAAHASQEMPVGSVGKAVGVRDVVGLFDQLTVNLIP